MLNPQTSEGRASATGKCLRCACRSEGEDKAAGFVCYSCDESDGDVTGEGNRIDAMPDVTITGYWRDSGTEGTYACKVGEYLNDMSEDEDLFDESIFYYFESLESVSKGTGEFIVTSYQFNDQQVELSKAQIQSQINHDAIDAFFVKYQPIPNRNDTAGLEIDDQNYGYSTFGVDLKAVQAADRYCVWTVVDSDTSDGTVLINGMWICNRAYYIITQQPWKDGEQISIRMS